MKKPSFLKPGSLIRIVSPSGPVDPLYVEASVAALRERGFRVELGKHVFDRLGCLAGDDDSRASDLQQALDDPDTDAIICSRGGYGLIRIVDRLDFAAMGRKPKWLVGFSDITVLHNALSAAGIESLHAIMCKQVSMKGWPFEKLLAFLQGEAPVYECSTNGLNRTGKAKGRLTGGNLSLVYALQGTPFAVMPSDRILFLEDLCEPAYHVDRMLQSLRLAGVFDSIAGMVVGKFTDISSENAFPSSVYELVNEMVKDRRIPVCYGFPAGHEDYNLPLIMGAETELEITQSQVLIKQF